MLITDEIVHSLIENKVNEINISMSGGTKSTYESIQKGASWEKLWFNIKMLNEHKLKMNSTKPRITINFVLNKKSIHELSDVLPLLKVNNIESIHFRQLIEFPNMDKEFYEKMKLGQIEIGLVPGIIALFRINGLLVSQSIQCFPEKDSVINKQVKKYTCILPFFQLFISPEGKTKFCLFHDWWYSIVDQDLKSILNKKDVCQYLDNPNQNSSSNFCNNCPFMKAII